MRKKAQTRRSSMNEGYRCSKVFWLRVDNELVARSSSRLVLRPRACVVVAFKKPLGALPPYDPDFWTRST
jgi:hypothetical protein